MAKCAFCHEKEEWKKISKIGDLGFCSADCYQKYKKQLENKVQEYKRKCNQCGKVWHSLLSREEKMKQQSKSDSWVQGLTACGGDLQTASQSQRNREAKEQTLADLKKCPSCGSGDYTEEIIAYDKK